MRSRQKLLCRVLELEGRLRNWKTETAWTMPRGFLYAKRTEITLPCFGIGRAVAELENRNRPDNAQRISVCEADRNISAMFWNWKGGCGTGIRRNEDGKKECMDDV